MNMHNGNSFMHNVTWKVTSTLQKCINNCQLLPCPGSVSCKIASCDSTSWGFGSLVTIVQSDDSCEPMSNIIETNDSIECMEH